MSVCLVFGIKKIRGLKVCKSKRFEIQGRRHQKSKTGVSVAPRKGPLLAFWGFAKIHGLAMVECHLMLIYPPGPNRNTSFLDTPFLSDHTWYHVELFNLTIYKDPM